MLPSNPSSGSDQVFYLCVMCDIEQINLQKCRLIPRFNLALPAGFRKRGTRSRDRSRDLARCHYCEAVTLMRGVKPQCHRHPNHRIRR
jgi:hypothetical protein